MGPGLIYGKRACIHYDFIATGDELRYTANKSRAFPYVRLHNTLIFQQLIPSKMNKTYVQLLRKSYRMFQGLYLKSRISEPLPKLPEQWRNFHQNFLQNWSHA